MNIDTQELARKVRLHVVNMAHSGGGSHVGSALSMTDIIAVLYGDIMNVRSDDPKWRDRDRFLLSKGHAGSCVYATLAECGFFSAEVLSTHYQDGSILSGHVSHKEVPGVELSTGSLGHALPVATGMAKAGKLSGQSHRVFCVLSDGECDEGSNWEAAMFAAHHKLDNLVCVVDYNKIQSLDLVANTLGLEPFVDKWVAFGWHVHEVDGHNHAELRDALSQAGTGKPQCVVAHTTKGKAVSFMENSVLWHYRSPQGDEYQNALAELSAELGEAK